MLLAGGFIPQFGGLSYESALLAGLVIPTLVAVVTALETRASGQTPVGKLAVGLKIGGAFGALAIFASFLHGLRTQLCDPWDGLFGFVFGPGMGALMGGTFGATVGVFTGYFPAFRRFAPWLAVLGPLSSALVSVVRFFTSPMVFAFDTFVGYFAGPLYETVLQSRESLIEYRMGSLLTLVALSAFFALLGSPHANWSQRLRGRPWTFVLALMASAGSIMLALWGTKLGHYSTAESIREALGRELTRGRCRVVYSKAVHGWVAELLSDECNELLTEVEGYFGTKGPERVTVYLFATPEEKGQLMGAAHTYIAKPWRNEVYLQQAGYPHPVLGHELAHVVAGSFGSGPFKIAGSLGGLLPDPGRIEGYAVAASPRLNDPLTLQEWSRALLDLNLLPPLGSVFHLSFLEKNASIAYTVAGAFVDYLRAEYGPEGLRRWYSGALPKEAFGHDLGELEAKWRDSLKQVPISEQALRTAKARFDQPGVFGRACPHEVDKLFGEAQMFMSYGNPGAAERVYSDILSLDPKNLGARIGLGQSADRAGKPEVALERYKDIALDENLHQLERLWAEEARADILLRQGAIEQARALYQKVKEAVVDEDRLRTLEVKSSVDQGLGQQAVVDLLIGEGRFGPSWDVAAVKLGQWFETEPHQGLAPFLIGKNLYGRGYFTQAASYLDLAVRRPSTLPRVQKEALRVRLFIACAQKDRRKIREVHQKLEERADLTVAERLSLGRVAARCGAME